MAGIEPLLWVLAALLVFGGLRLLVRRYPPARPWLLGATGLYLVGFFTWALMTPGNWRGEIVLAIFFAYAIWVGEIVARARDDQPQEIRHTNTK